MDAADLAHLAPSLRVHLNPYGRCVFNVEAGVGQPGLRPLCPRSAASA